MRTKAYTPSINQSPPRQQSQPSQPSSNSKPSIKVYEQKNSLIIGDNNYNYW